MAALRTHHHFCADKLDSLAPVLQEHSLRQQRERQVFFDTQESVERQRRDVDAVLESMVERVQTQMPVHTHTNTNTAHANESAHIRLSTALSVPEDLLFGGSSGPSAEERLTSVASSASNAFSKLGSMVKSGFKRSGASVGGGAGSKYVKCVLKRRSMLICVYVFTLYAY